MLFIGFALALGTALGLMFAEFGAGLYLSHVLSREQTDPGFLAFEPTLGWRMAPNWNGRHRHFDFDVTYSTNPMGLRGPWPEETHGKRRYAFVGDSFTFGLGVNDGETFVRRLSDADPRSDYLNAGIAGYSTDQEYLFLKSRLPQWRADEVILVVYLANDLLDNTLGYPLQANMGKPVFVVEGESLRLTNVPVPLGSKPPEARQQTPGTMILGEEEAQRRARSWRSTWQLARLLGLSESVGSGDVDGMASRLAYPLDLFTRLTQEIRRLCEENNVRLTLLLMPGRSYVDAPNSLSAQYQDYLRRAILGRQADFGVAVVDLATTLRDEQKRGQKGLFHPNEGHLTVLGHKIVAERWMALRSGK